MAARKALPQIVACQRAQGARAQIRLGQAASEHHLSHAASAFYPSPFQRAAVLTMDGVGEWATTSAGVGNGHELKIQKEINFPHSLGLLYAAFTYYTGFKVNSGDTRSWGSPPMGPRNT